MVVLGAENTTQKILTTLEKSFYLKTLPSHEDTLR